MTKIKKPSYLKPIPERLHVLEWQRLLNEESLPLTTIVPDWDPLMPIHVIGRINLDVEGVFSDCQLSSDAVLRIGISWYSPGTGLRGVGDVKDLNGYSQRQNIILSANIAGTLLADRVILSADLVLLDAGTNSSRLAPRLPGTLLSSEKVTVLLEGEGARFPVELIHFAESSWLPAHGGWYFDWNPHMLRQTVLGDVRLYLNADHTAVKRAVSEYHSADRAIRETIFFDMARVMITGALRNSEFVESVDEYPDGSIGAAIRRLIRSLFPNETFESLESFYQQEPYRFECTLQEKLKLFQEKS